MRHFDYSEFRVQFSMLHDQLLTDAAYENGVLRLTFGEFRIFREDYSDETYYDRYKDYRECTLEIHLHTFPVEDMNEPTLCILKGERFKCMKMDFDILVDFLRSLRARFIFAAVSNNDELELQMLSSHESEMKRKYRDCEYRLSVFANAFDFIWR